MIAESRVGRKGLLAGMLLLLLPLIACAPEDTAGLAPGAAPQPVIVEFSVPPAAPGASLMAALEDRGRIAAAIKSRLKPEVRKTVRVYDNLPLMALTADAKTVSDLLKMKEVTSIRPDREVETPRPAPEFTVPSLPAGAGGN